MWKGGGLLWTLYHWDASQQLEVTNTSLAIIWAACHLQIVEKLGELWIDDHLTPFLCPRCMKDHGNPEGKNLAAVLLACWWHTHGLCHRPELDCFVFFCFFAFLPANHCMHDQMGDEDNDTCQEFTSQASQRHCWMNATTYTWNQATQYTLLSLAIMKH